MSLYRFLEFELNETEFKLTRQGSRVALEPKILRVLLVLVGKPGRLVNKQEILETVWPDTFVEESVLTRAVAQLRRELGDNSREPRIIETVPTKGYRFIAPLEKVESTEASAELQKPELPAPPMAGKRRVWRWVALGSALIFVLACATLAARRWWGPDKHPIQSLAVLPLDDLSPGQKDEYFADGLTDELIEELAQIPQLRVVSRTSAMQEKGKRKPVSEIARELGVEAIVEGSVVRSGGRVRITAQLIDARTDRHLWANTYEGSLDDILSLQDSVAREIAAQTRTVLSPTDRVRLNNAKTIKPEAYDDYLRGLYFIQRRDGAHAVQYFRDALRLEPNYAAAWAGLSRAIDTEFRMEQARADDVEPEALSAAKRAIELDPDGGEGYISLGTVEYGYLRDWASGERDLRKGISLSPSDPSGYINLSLYLISVKRTEEAVTAARRALQLDPLGFFTNRNLASVLFYDRKYDESRATLRRTLELAPDLSGYVENWNSYIDAAQGQYAEAVNAELLGFSAYGAPPEMISSLRAAFKAGGWNRYQQTRIAILLPDASEACSSWSIAMSYSELRDAPNAFRWFQRAANDHCIFTTGLAADPRLDPFRRDPHYLKFQDGLNLPH